MGKKPMTMAAGNKNIYTLILWIIALLGVGSLIGFVTKPEISTWYSTLNRSELTPPNYVFPIAWTLLYAIIGICGWLIWSTPRSSRLGTIKILYIFQLILNWVWSPLFFNYHLTGLSLLVVVCMDLLVGVIIVLAHSKMRSVSLLMMPYLAWILFATHLNYFIWLNN